MPSIEHVARTRAMARIIGPYLIVVATALLVRHDTLAAFLAEFMANAPLVFASGAFTLMAGLALVCAHHHWNSIEASVISVLAIAVTLKGASLMIAPQFGADLADHMVQRPTVLVLAVILEALVGAWLMLVGWRRPKAPILPT